MQQLSKVPNWIQPYFWDTNIAKLNLELNKNYIITKLLNFGNQATLNWLFKVYTEDDVLNTVKQSRTLNKKTARFWQTYFNLKEDEMKAFENNKYTEAFYIN